jgi:hypothetical protein
MEKKSVTNRLLPIVGARVTQAGGGHGKSCATVFVTDKVLVFELGGLRFTATVGRFDDGQIGELLLNNTKPELRRKRVREMPSWCSHSRFSMAPTSTRSARHYAVMAAIGRSVGTARR